MEAAVVLDEAWRLGTGDLERGFFEDLGSDSGVEPRHGGAQAIYEHHVRVASTLGTSVAVSPPTPSGSGATTSGILAVRS